MASIYDQRREIEVLDAVVARIHERTQELLRNAQDSYDEYSDVFMDRIHRRTDEARELEQAMKLLP